MELGDVLLVPVADMLGVILGQLLERLLERGVLGAGAGARAATVDRRADAALGRDDGLAGSTARGSSTNFQVSPSLIISGTWRNATPLGLIGVFGAPAKITAFS